MTDWLIDKSALVRLGSAADGEAWADRIERGLVRVSIAWSCNDDAIPILVRGASPLTREPGCVRSRSGRAVR